MTLTKSTVTRAIDVSGNDIRVFLDTLSKIIQGVAIVDDSGEQSGILTNPLYVTAEGRALERILEDILTELKLVNTYNQVIVSERLTELDIEG